MNALSPTPDGYNLSVSVDEDFGDAPASYDGTTAAASHVVGDLKLGATVTADNTAALNSGTTKPSPIASAAATGDGASDDGVAAFPPLSTALAAGSYTVPVTLSGASAPGNVCGWIDFNINGLFDNPAERACATFATGATSVNLTWTVPATIVSGSSFARIRASYDPILGSAPSANGLLNSGEVEDYSVSITPPAFAISGTVYEDVNYGGGVGRAFSAALGMSLRPGVRVELYTSAGTFVAAALTDASGAYTFAGQLPGTYTVRVVNSFVTSSRAGGCTPSAVVGTAPAGCAQVPVQTFVNGDVNRVGGENPAGVDAGISSTTLPAGSESIASVTVGSANVTGVSFGFNFDTVVNKNPGGQGSLNQFIFNADALSNTGLAQSGNRQNAGVNQALPAGVETSIFMASDGLVHPGLRAGLPSQLTAGVLVLNQSAVALANVTGANANATSIDGTTQTVNVGNTNTGLLGTGGTVGYISTLTLDQVQRPEVEIVGSSAVQTGLNLLSNDDQVRGLSVRGFGNAPNGFGIANIHIGGGTTGTLIEQNFTGFSATAASLCTGATTTFSGLGDNIRSDSGSNGFIRNNLISCVLGKGIGIEIFATGWLITDNEIRANAIGAPSLDGIDIEENANTNIVRGNLIADNGGNGIDSFNGGGSDLIEKNTIIGNGFAQASAPNETAGVRLLASNTTVQNNVIASNYGAGIMVTDAVSAILISKNSIFANGTLPAANGTAASGQIGIDLLKAGESVSLGTAPYVTKNDSGDADTGGNGLLNFPVFQSATISAGNLVVTGFARPGSTIELFIAAPDASGFGEGQTYLFTQKEGGALDTDAGTGTYNGTPGTDTTNRFSFSVPLPAGVVVGTPLTATATCLASDCAGTTVVSNSTSEFSFNIVVTLPPPVAVPDSSSTPTNAPKTFSVTGNDTATSPNTIAPATTTFPAAGQPAGAVISGGGKTITVPGQGSYTLDNLGNVTFTPVSGFSGTATPVQYTVNDSSGATSNPATISMTVTPVAVNDTATTAPSTLVNIPVLSNDLGTGKVLTSLLFPAAGQPAGSVLSGGGKILTNAQGVYTIKPDGTVDFTPALGFTGAATPVLYTFVDGAGQTSSAASITVTVSAIVPPTATSDSAITPKNVAVTLAGATNDTAGTLPIAPASVVFPAAGQPGTATISNAGKTLTVAGEGTYQVQANGSVQFTPVGTFAGATTPVKYTVKDTAGTVSNAATLNVTVTNQSPTAATATNVGVISTSPAAPLSPGVSGSDPDGTIVTYTITTLPTAAMGTLFCNGAAIASVPSVCLPAQLTFKPNPAFSGNATFQYTVTDNNGATSPAATYTIPVAQPALPVANDDSSSTNPNTPVTFSVTGNDTATSPNTIAGATTTFPAAGQPAGAVISNLGKTITVPNEGSYTLDNLGNVTFTPVATFTVGTTTPVNYTVNDNLGAVSNPASIRVTVPASVDLGIVKTGPAYFKPGDTLSYTLKVTNTGVAATGVTVTDILPAGLTFVSADNGGVQSAGVVTWNLGAVAAGANLTLTVVGTAPSAASTETNNGPASLLNKAAVTANETEANTANNVSQSSAGLVYAKLSKSVRNFTQNPTGPFGLSGTGKPGELLEYCIDFRNYGVAVSNFAVTDPVPANTDAALSGYGAGLGLEVVRGSTTTRTSASDADGGSLDAGTLNLSLGVLAAGETGSVCFKSAIK